MIIKDFLFKIGEIIQKAGGNAVLVGGAVRDTVLGLESKDFDIEVFGIPLYEELEKIVSTFADVKLIGKSFGVLHSNIGGYYVSFSLPRKDYKIAEGHKGFEVLFDSSMSFKEAAYRRDFTINTIGIDLVSGEILDPFEGRKDLSKKIIKHINSRYFIQDPLRILRAVQFAGRFNFKIAPKTLELCKEYSDTLKSLSKERIFEELKKLLLKSKKPSKGLKQLVSTGSIVLFPELEALISTLQDFQRHPEGNVWNHTMMTVDEMVKFKTGDEDKDLIFMLAALCHDLGKSVTTEKGKNGRWISHNHEKEGEEITLKFLNRIIEDKKLIKEVISLVGHHMRPSILFAENEKRKIKNSVIRRLSLSVCIEDVIKLAKADYFGRKGRSSRTEVYLAGEWLRLTAEELKVEKEKPKPILMGRHLLKLGIKEGPEIGMIIKKAFEKQLEGEIFDEENAVEWAKKDIENEKKKL